MGVIHRVILLIIGKKLMISSDRDAFDDIMLNCFQNYGRAAPKGLIEMWFDALKSFNFVHVRNAFTAYLMESDKRKGPPAMADILKLAKKSAASAYVQIRDTRSKRCYVEGCNSLEDQISACEYRPDIFICRHHLEEFVLSTMPNSNHARVIREAREFETEAKRLGKTNKEHFDALHPGMSAKIEKTVNQNSEMSALQEERPKSAEEIFYESTAKPIANREEIEEYDIPF